MGRGRPRGTRAVQSHSLPVPARGAAGRSAGGLCCAACDTSHAPSSSPSAKDPAPPHACSPAELPLSFSPATYATPALYPFFAHGTSSLRIFRVIFTHRRSLPAPKHSEVMHPLMLASSAVSGTPLPQPPSPPVRTRLTPRWPPCPSRCPLARCPRWPSCWPAPPATCGRCPPWPGPEVRQGGQGGEVKEGRCS